MCDSWHHFCLSFVVGKHVVSVVTDVGACVVVRVSHLVMGGWPGWAGIVGLLGG